MRLDERMFSQRFFSFFFPAPSVCPFDERDTRKRETASFLRSCNTDTLFFAHSLYLEKKKQMISQANEKKEQEP